MSDVNVPAPVSIGGRLVGPGHPPLVVAELSANHNGSLDRALQILDEAAKAGAEAVKLQTYTADTITLESDAEEFQIRGGLWDGQSLYELYEMAHTPWEWHRRLFEHGRDLGLIVFSSPFDPTAVDLLEDLDAPAYKIASFEIVDLPLIEYAARTGKPLVISTGMANEQEIHEAVTAARDAGCEELVLLHCVSGYPAPPGDYNLRTIPDMRDRFGTVTGLSDHTLDNTTAIASVAMGAAVIEKHFTLDRNGGGPDDSFSLEPPDLARLSADARTAWEALGAVHYGRTGAEESMVQYRRSLYFTADVAAGEILTERNVRSIRPGHGLAPKWLGRLLGARATRDVTAGTRVRAEDVDVELVEDP